MNTLHPPPSPSDKKSQTWSETLGISYPRRHGPGVQWKGLGSIWKALGSSWNGLGFNRNGLGPNGKALNQERAVTQKNRLLVFFVLCMRIRNNFDNKCIIFVQNPMNV